MPASRQLCSLYSSAAGLVVLSSSQTTEGLWVFNGFAERLASLEDRVDVGDAVARSLAASGSGVRHPSDWPGFTRAVNAHLKRVGVSSLASLTRGALCVQVVADGGKVIVTPTVGSGGVRSRFFEERVELAETIVGAGPEVIGERIHAAFGRSR